MNDLRETVARAIDHVEKDYRRERGNPVSIALAPLRTRQADAAIRAVIEALAAEAEAEYALSHRTDETAGRAADWLRAHLDPEAT